MIQILLLIFTLASPPLAAQGLDQALAEQRDLPSYAARAATAKARSSAAQRFYAGKAPVEAAFPELSGGDWLDPAWLAGQLSRLDQAARLRAVEARAPLGELDARTQRQLSAARTRALDAEESADAAERRLLLSVQALLEQHPALTRSHLADAIESLEMARAVQAERWAQADAADQPALAASLAALDAERAAYAKLGDRIVGLAVLPGASLELDASALQDPVRAPFAAQRLSLLLPLSDGSVQEPLLGWIEDQRASMQASPPLDIAAPADLEAQIGAVEDRLAQRTEEPVSQAWAALDSLELARLQDAYQRSLEAAEAQQAQDAETLKALDADNQARREADEARSAATDQQARWVAQVLTSVADDHDRATSDNDKLEEHSDAAAELLSGLRTDLTEAKSDVVQARAKSALAGDRQEAIDQAYAELRGQVGLLRRAAISAADSVTDRQEIAAAIRRQVEGSRAQLELDRERVQEMAEGPERAKVTERLKTWDEVLQAMETIASLEETRAFEHQTQVVELLEQAKAERRELRGEISAAERANDRAALVDELRLEFKVVVPRLVSTSDSRLGHLRENLRSLSFWGTLAWGLLRFGLFVLIWRWLRDRLPTITQRVIDLRAREQHRVERQATERLQLPLASASRALLDLLVVGALLRPMEAFFPEAALLMLGWWQFLLLRFLVRLYHLLVARNPANRPALAHVSEAGFTLGERTLRLLAGWGILRQFVGFLTLDLLKADALHRLTMMGFTAALIVLVLVLLHAWEPTLRSMLRRQGGDDRIRAFLTSEPAQPTLTRWIRATADLLLLGSAALWGLLQSKATEGSALGRALNVFYRYSMSDKPEAEAELRPVPESLRAAILEPADPEPVPRPELDEIFYKALGAWERDEAQGTMALVGDRGAGHGTWLESVAKELASRGLGLRRMAIERRILSERDLVCWLADSLELGECVDLETLEARLKDRPKTVFIIEAGERAFLRKVGGFEGMRALFEVVGRMGDQHFWVVCFHLPAWAYLSRLERLLKVHLFHHVVEVPQMTESQLRKLVVSRTQAAGYQVDFTALVRGGALSGDQDGELERATVAFFRVLGEASLGNPAVALRLWVESLRVVDDGHVQVRMGSAVAEDLAKDLGQAELFVLSAVRMQNSLSEAELGMVNNMPPAAVRGSLQVLRGRGLVTSSGQVQVPLRAQAKVTRTLWRRNLLDWRE
ncbi:MAG: hypothetical protein VX899_09705 [Myxococcota bacterium]|nr:hypothetical protein [Myxococcota bacterium]